MRAENGSQYVADFLLAGVGARGGDDWRHQVVAALGRAAYGRERSGDLARAALGLHAGQTLALLAFDARIDAQGRDPSLLPALKAIDADDHALAVAHRALVLEGRARDLALRVAELDGAHHAAELVDSGDQLER